MSSTELSTENKWRFELTEAQQKSIKSTEFAIQAIVDELDSAVCENQEQLDELTETQTKLKAFRLEAAKIIMPIKGEINEEKNRILDIEKRIVKAAKTAEERCGSLCGVYRAKLAEEQRQLEELARKEAEEQRQAEIEEQAEEIEETQGELAAESFRQDAYSEVAPEVEVAELVRKPENTQLRYNYSAEVVDVEKVPRKYLVVDMTKINAEARSFKDDFSIPGCRLIKKAKQSTVRRAK